MAFHTDPSQPLTYRRSWRDRLPAPLRGVASLPWWQVGLALLIAGLMVSQFDRPNSRVIKALAGLILFVVAYRTRPFYALCFITVFFPFPFSIFIGSSTMIFIVLSAMIYLARLSLKQVPPIRRTPLDPFIGVMIGCYILSFYNVDTPAAVRQGIVNLVAILASIMLFYMTANFIRTEAQLRTFVKVLAITMAVSMFVGLWELFLPGVPIVPHWIMHKQAEIVHTGGGYRVGGPFYDFELFGEFMALSFFFLFFFFRRAETPNARFFGAGLTVVAIFCLLTTVTRGATLAFGGGIVYLGILIRKHLKFRDVTAILLSGVVVFLILEFVVANFTVSGSVFDRLFGTEFHGLTPDSRAHWPEIWERVLQHPFVGWGPYYDLGKTESLTGHGLDVRVFPHSQYLFYAHTIGLTGMFAFIAMAARLYWISLRSRAQGLQDPVYAKSLMVVLNVMLVVFLVDQTKIEFLRNTTYEYFPWLFMGLIVATHRLIKEREAGIVSEA